MKNSAEVSFDHLLKEYNLNREDLLFGELYTVLESLLDNDKKIGMKEFMGQELNFYERDFSIIKDAADANVTLAQIFLGLYLWSKGGEKTTMCEAIKYIKFAASKGDTVALTWLRTDPDYLNLKNDGYDVQI